MALVFRELGNGCVGNSQKVRLWGFQKALRKVQKVLKIMRSLSINKLFQLQFVFLFCKKFIKKSRKKTENKMIYDYKSKKKFFPEREKMWLPLKIVRK